MHWFELFVSACGVLVGVGVGRTLDLYITRHKLTRGL